MSDREVPRVRVLVVDDSAFARKVVRECLAADPVFDVVGIARDGLEALEKIVELQPDVITLDLVMPNLDGLGLLRSLPLATKTPRVVVVSIADEESALGLAALELGAVDVVHKPTGQATARLYELGDELRRTVFAAASARAPIVGPPAASPQAREVTVPVPTRSKRRAIVIGASTGGPQALGRLLRALPAALPVPVACVLHMPPGYTAGFAARLDDECALKVVEASPGQVVRPGMALIAQAGQHLRLVPRGDELVTAFSFEPHDSPHRPSVDVLFHSVEPLGAAVIGVVLTGMGDDGARGAQAIRRAGGVVLTESEASCVVYGMPRAVVELGASTEAASIDRMHEVLLSYL